MTFGPVRLIRRATAPASSPARWQPLWEGRVGTTGFLAAVIQAQALATTAPSVGVARIRNVTTGAATPPVEWGGLERQLPLPELPVTAGDLIQIEARPVISGTQVYVEHAAATVSTVSLVTIGVAAVAPVFASVSISPTTLVVGSPFTLTAALSAGSLDLGGTMAVEVDWLTPDGSNPMGGVDVLGGWYRGLLRNPSSIPGSVTFAAPELVIGVAGVHRLQLVATNSTGTVFSPEIVVTVAAEAPSNVRGSYVTPVSDGSHDIASASVTPALVVGDMVVAVIAAPGPSDVGSVTYTHTGWTLVADAAGNAFRPRVRIVRRTYTGADTWTISASSNVRVAVVGLSDTATLTAGSPAYSLTPTDPPGVAAAANSIGLAVTALNFTSGEVLAPPAAHTTVLNSGSAAGVRQIYVARRALTSAGVYDPGPATVGLANESGTAIALVGSPTAPTVDNVYAWEDRPPYVEPDPTAAPGTPGKVLATLLGITSRVSVGSVPAFNAAKVAAVPGRQIYVTVTLVGNGASQLLSWASNKAGAGAGAGGALVGGGTDPDGTVDNPIMITCAPGVWLDGGQVDGASNSASRCINIRGASNVWLYGANFRRAQFPVKYDQCPGSASNPFRVEYCTITMGGDALLHFGGYFAVQAGNKIGESRHAIVRHCELSYAGRADNRFGEAVYFGHGGATSWQTSRTTDVLVTANWIHHVSAEACDVKVGSERIKFNYNLVTDCGDSKPRTGNSANEGFPGSVQFVPASDSLTATHDPVAGYDPGFEAIGNRFVRCSSASQKFPTGQIVVGHRSTKVIGNLFSQCTVPNAPQIRVYQEDQQSFGSVGTIEIHNNTSLDARTLLDLFIGGGANPAETANAIANTNASNNVGTSSQTGVNLVVTAGAFTSDGTGYEGSGASVATGGALDVAGANTSALWSTDYAGGAVAAPVKPGARQ